MIDIIDAFEGVYDKRILITGCIKSRNRTYPDDMQIHRIQTYYNTTKLKRLITWSKAFIQMVWIIKIYYDDAELFLVSNPPFTTFIPLFCKNTFSLLVFDIYPDVINKSGLLKKESLLVRLWAKANRAVFTRAKRIFTISYGMKRAIEVYVDASKINVVSLWSDEVSIAPIEKKNNMFLKEQGLESKFVVLYSGNLGFSHDVEVIVDIAEKLKAYDNFFILVIGDGEKRELLVSRIQKQLLSNCRLLPWQSFDMLPYTLSAADIAVVLHSSFASNLSVPSKTFNYLSVGSPLLCVAAQDSELASIVTRYDVGRCFNRDAVDSMVQYIKDVQADPVYHSRLQYNALNASKDFTIKNARKFVDALR